MTPIINLWFKLFHHFQRLSKNLETCEIFVAFVVRQCHYEFNTVFWKSCIVFCSKPKEVDPPKIISLQQKSVSIALTYIINNCVLKLTESGHQWLRHFFFLLKIPIPAISSYWRNDTPTFVTWRISSPNQFVPVIVSSFPCLSWLFRHKLLYFLFIFFKEPISFIGSLDKCHASVFNALVFPVDKHTTGSVWIHQSFSRIFFSAFYVRFRKFESNNFWLPEANDYSFTP